jgi:acylpyruvate hydrolase
VGYARTPPVWMKPGDEIVVEVDQVGRASARIG